MLINGLVARLPSSQKGCSQKRIRTFGNCYSRCVKVKGSVLCGGVPRLRTKMEKQSWSPQVRRKREARCCSSRPVEGRIWRVSTSRKRVCTTRRKGSRLTIDCERPLNIFTLRATSLAVTSSPILRDGKRFKRSATPFCREAVLD